EPDAARKVRQRTLALGGKDPFVRELPLQALERCEMVADPEAFDRQRPKTKVTAAFVQLRTSQHVHALAVDEVEAKRIEPGAQDRDAEARTVCRILEREKHALPTLVA